MLDQQTTIDTPLDVRIVDDEVAISGPDGLQASMTREAAVASAKRLLRAAGEGPTDTYQKPLG